MSAHITQNLTEAADITAVTQLILRERESRDLWRWETMRECFWPESLVRVSWFRGNGPDFVTGSIEMARRGIPAKHRLAPILVRLAGERAVASLHGIIDLPVVLKGFSATLSTHSRFLYRAERRDGRWGLMGFDAIYMRDELTPDLPGQTISIDPAEVKDFRKSYRLLSYYLHSQGYKVDSALPGEDLPETVEALYQELFEWSGQAVPKQLIQMRLCATVLLQALAGEYVAKEVWPKGAECGTMKYRKYLRTSWETFRYHRASDSYHDQRKNHNDRQS